MWWCWAGQAPSWTPCLLGPTGLESPAVSLPLQTPTIKQRPKRERKGWTEGGRCHRWVRNGVTVRYFCLSVAFQILSFNASSSTYKSPLTFNLLGWQEKSAWLISNMTKPKLCAWLDTTRGERGSMFCSRSQGTAYHENVSIKLKP